MFVQEIFAIAYGVLGKHLVDSYIGDFTLPYSEELPIWINFFIFFGLSEVN